MADSTTRAARPGREQGGKAGGKEDTIFGLPTKTAIIVGLVVVVGGYLYIKSKTSQQTGQGSGSGGGQQHHSPTGMSRQHLTIWVKDHHGHKHG